MPEARVTPVDALPGGEATVVLEREGLIEVRISRSEPPDRIAASLQRQMQHVIDSGTWKQHWPGDRKNGDG